MSLMQVEKRELGMHRGDGKIVELNHLIRSKNSLQNFIISTDDGSNLKERLKIGNGTGKAEDYIIGKGSYGTAYQATLKEKNSSVIKCVVKFPSYLIHNNFYTFLPDGGIKTDPTKMIAEDAKLNEFYKEIDYISRLRMGIKLVDSGITDVNRDINGSELLRDLRDSDAFLHKHKGHEFIHRLLVYNKGIIPCIVSEYCEGDLAKINHYMTSNQLIKNSNLFEDPKYWTQVVYEIYQGISYMHSMHISHNDIKTENIFFKIVDRNPLVITYRISDFGFCSDDTKSNKLIGTPYYLSPELIEIQDHVEGAKSDPFSNDAYAMALTCIEILDTPNIPQTREILNQIQKKEKKNYADITNEKDINLESLLALICLSPESKRLYLFNEILKNKLHANASSLL